MAKLFEAADGIVCRSCGATHGRPNDGASHDVCYSCWARFSASCRTQGDEPNEDRLNRWLARQLYLSARRLKIYSVTGRCEALSGVDTNAYLQGLRVPGGYQCGMHATRIRDGRRVCPSHAERAKHVQFICDPVTDPYQDFSSLLAELAVIDDAFFACIERGIEAARLAKEQPKAGAN